MNAFEQTFDLISTVELTASAAVVVAGVALLFGQTRKQQAVIVAGMTLWFILVIIAGAQQWLHFQHGIGVQGLGLAVVSPIIGLSLLCFGTKAGRHAIAHASMEGLHAIQAVRILGISFVLLYAFGRLPAPFAPVAGWGDIAIGLLAIPMAIFVASRGVRAARPAFVFNFLGLLDLCAAVALGVMSSPGPLRIITGEPSSEIMSTLPWLIIPCFLVPTLTVVHLVAFAKLRRWETASS